MSEEGGKGPNVGDILIGTFLIVLGLCSTLAGGACATMTVVMSAPTGDLGLFTLIMLIIPLAIAAAGIFGIYHGIRIARSRYRDG